MPRIMLTAGMLIPRILALLLLVGGWFGGLFSSMVWPILGVIFLPTTLMWYGIVYHWFNGQWGVVAVGGLVVAALIDIGPAAAQRRTRLAKV